MDTLTQEPDTISISAYCKSSDNEANLIRILYHAMNVIKTTAAGNAVSNILSNYMVETKI